MDNTVLLLGLATVGDIMAKITLYTNPDGLVVSVPEQYFTNEFLVALGKLNVPHEVIAMENLLDVEPKQILIFTDGIKDVDVSVLTEAIKSGIDVVFCKAKL